MVNSAKPRLGFIARKLASALGSFFDIDESIIRSRLLKSSSKKTKISMKNVRIKDRIIRENDRESVILTGIIKEVMINWRWNDIANKKKSFLLLKGANVHIRPISAIEAMDLQAEQESSLSATSLDSDPGEKVSQKKQPKLVKKILKNVRFKLEDLEVHLTPPIIGTDSLPSLERSIVLHGKTVDLESLGTLNIDSLKQKEKTFRKRKKANNSQHPLLQQLRIESLSAKLVELAEDGTERLLPLLDPYSFSALLKRFHGERFSGLVEGLEVIGDVLPVAGISPICYSFSDEERDGPDESLSLGTSLSGEIEINADGDEVETSLRHVISSNSWEEVRQHESKESRDLRENSEVRSTLLDGISLHLGSAQATALFSTISMFAKGSTPTNNFDGKEMKRKLFRDSIVRPGGLRAFPKFMSSRELNKSSIFNLRQLESIQLVLPNRSFVVAKECVLRVKADGTLFILEGNGGVFLDGEKLLAPGDSWTVDVVKKSIDFHPSGIMARSFAAGNLDRNKQFDLGLKELANFSLGMSEIFKLRRSVLGTPTPRAEKPGIGKSSGWSLKVNGPTNISF